MSGDDPRYLRGRGSGEFWAHFSSGAVVKATRSRTRRYPGLEGPAPQTLSFYHLSLSLSSPRGSILDGGCGSGVGARLLASAHQHVVGLDSDRLALAFARQVEPTATYIAGDLCASVSLPPIYAAVVADVLGQVPSPTAALLTLRSHLQDGAWLLLAEPAAHPGQRLIPPVRRAFSRPRLRSLLTQSGFEIQGWRSSQDFNVVYATPSRCSDWQRFRQAVELLDNQRPEAAFDLLQRLSTTPSAALRLESALLHAAALLASKETNAARELLQSLAAAGQDDPRPEVGLALLAISRGQPRQAFEAVERAQRIDPCDPGAARALATVMQDRGPQYAIPAWRLCHNLAPDDENAAKTLAAELMQAGELTSSRDVLSQLASYRVN